MLGSVGTVPTFTFMAYTWGVQVVRYPNFFLGEWKQIETWKLLEETWLFFRLGEAKWQHCIPVECLWRGRVAIVFLILKWRRLHSKNSAWLSDCSTCVARNQSKFIDNCVRQAVMPLWTWKMCVRGCDTSKKAESRVTWGVQVLRSPNLFKKTTHHRKLKMQSFLNVITL